MSERITVRQSGDGLIGIYVRITRANLIAIDTDLEEGRLYLREEDAERMVAAIKDELLNLQLEREK